MGELIKALKRAQIIEQAEPGQGYTLSSGNQSSFYVHLKKAYGDSYLLNLLVNHMYPIIDRRVDTLAGEGMGGIPLTTALSVKYGFNLTLVREQPKSYGTKRWLEGYVPQSRNRVAVIDDVFTTGGSLTRTIDILRLTGAEIVQACVVVKRQEGELTVPLHYLLTLEDLV